MVPCATPAGELLGSFGSWGDTLSDEEVLEALRRLNACGWLFYEVFASTGGRLPAGAPQARRSIKRRDKRS